MVRGTVAVTGIAVCRKAWKVKVRQDGVISAGVLPTAVTEALGSRYHKACIPKICVSTDCNRQKPTWLCLCQAGV